MNNFYRNKIQLENAALSWLTIFPLFAIELWPNNPVCWLLTLLLLGGLACARNIFFGKRSQLDRLYPTLLLVIVFFIGTRWIQNHSTLLLSGLIALLSLILVVVSKTAKDKQTTNKLCMTKDAAIKMFGASIVHAACYAIGYYLIWNGYIPPLIASLFPIAIYTIAWVSHYTYASCPIPVTTQNLSSKCKVLTAPQVRIAIIKNSSLYLLPPTKDTSYDLSLSATLPPNTSPNKVVQALTQEAQLPAAPRFLLRYASSCLYSAHLNYLYVYDLSQGDIPGLAEGKHGTLWSHKELQEALQQGILCPQLREEVLYICHTIFATKQIIYHKQKLKYQ